MNKRENFKTVEIKDRKWRIGKFDARTGSYMVIKVMGIIAPLLKGIKVGSETKVEDIDPAVVAFALTSLSEQDFNYIQDKCLGVCAEMLDAGPTPVLNANGSFGVLDVETDTMTIMALTAHALIFNVMGFFGESPLASMLGTALTSFQQNAKM